jgi:hypothetical protein
MTNYYENPEFKQKHLVYMKTKINCPDGCGSVTARHNMAHHRKTKKHINYMKRNTLTNKIVTEAKEEINEYFKCCLKQIIDEDVNIQCSVCNKPLNMNQWKQHCKSGSHKKNSKAIFGKITSSYDNFEII